MEGGEVVLVERGPEVVTAVASHAHTSANSPCLAWATVFSLSDRRTSHSLQQQNLHGMPGLLGGFVAGIAAFGQAAGVAPHGKAQLGFQLLSMLCTVAIASIGGALVSALATGRRGKAEK